MEEAFVYIVDDDESVRRSLYRLLSSYGMRVEAFGSGSELLNRLPLCSPACILLDVRMPGGTGLEIQEELTARGCQTPVIFLTGHATVPTSVRAMKAGAVDFLTKPVDENDLMAAVNGALKRDRLASGNREILRAIKEKFDTLSKREQQIFSQVVRGRLNKQIAHDFGIAEKTVKVHRANVIAKMGASSLAELVRMAERLGPVP